MEQQIEQYGFVDNGDGTISDPETGLMWLKDDSWVELGKILTWMESHEFAKKKNKKKFAGFSDWRIPTSQDAKSLYLGNEINTDKDGCELHISTLFTAGCGYTTWTSETRAAKQAMGYDLREDYEYWLDKNNCGFPSSVRLVRHIEAQNTVTVTNESGEAEEVQRFKDNQDGTITDRKTGLMWKKSDSFLDLDKWLSWPESKVYIKELCKGKFAKHTDWRMPARKEAISIFIQGNAKTDVYGDTIFLPEEFTPGAGQTTWTKTLHKTDESLAMRVFYYNGDYKWHKKGLRSHGVRAVRDIKESG